MSRLNLSHGKLDDNVLEGSVIGVDEGLQNYVKNLINGLEFKPFK